MLVFLLDVFLVMLSHVVLTRAQASPPPSGTKTIVPFSRSNSPGGRGCLSVGEAEGSISRASCPHSKALRKDFHRHGSGRSNAFDADSPRNVYYCLSEAVNL
ncbi:hypothetical protein F5X99DRAFT_126761 [Biscogniauxia marginata]|nr:hypothetical protein F5X99DRAFT_126761 [Biscogniauxia marginata]